MGKSAIKKDYVSKWAEVCEQIEAYFEDASEEYANKISMGLDMLDLSLALLSKQGLLSQVNVMVSGKTDNSKRYIQYSLAFEYDEESEEVKCAIVRTDKEESEL